MSAITAYTIHSTALRKAQENAAIREEMLAEPSFKFAEKVRIIYYLQNILVAIYHFSMFHQIQWTISKTFLSLVFYKLSKFDN